MAESLRSGPVELIPLLAEHRDDYIRMANEPSIGPRINVPQPFTAQDFEAQLAQMAAYPLLFIWMIAYDGALCGVINTGDTRNVKFFQGGYWLAPEFRGKAIAQTALMLVRDYLLTHHGAQRLQALVQPDNAASIRVLEKCGYVREGLLRKFYPTRTQGLWDVYMYAIVNES